MTAEDVIGSRGFLLQAFYDLSSQFMKIGEGRTLKSNTYILLSLVILDRGTVGGSTHRAVHHKASGGKPPYLQVITKMLDGNRVSSTYIEHFMKRLGSICYTRSSLFPQCTARSPTS